MISRTSSRAPHRFGITSAIHTPEDQGTVGDRRRHRERRRDDGWRRVAADACARQRVAAAHESAGGDRGAREHPEGRLAEVGRSRPDSRASRAGARWPRAGPVDADRSAVGRSRARQSWRWLGRHRRYHLERADDHAAVPANIPGLPGHNWSSAIAMATPIAHKVRPPAPRCRR